MIDRYLELQLIEAEMKLAKSINSRLIDTQPDTLITMRESCQSQNQLIDSILSKINSFLQSENTAGGSTSGTASGGYTMLGNGTQAVEIENPCKRCFKHNIFVDDICIYCKNSDDLELARIEKEAEEGVKSPLGKRTEDGNTCSSCSGCGSYPSFWAGKRIQTRICPDCKGTGMESS